MFQDILPRESSYSKSPALPRSKPRSKDRLELLRARVYTNLRGEGGKENRLRRVLGCFLGGMADRSYHDRPKPGSSR